MKFELLKKARTYRMQFGPFAPLALALFLAATTLARAAQSPWARVEIETGNAIGVLKPGDEAKLAFKVTNATDRPQGFSLTSVNKKMVFGWSRGAVAFNWWSIVDGSDGEYGLFTKAFQPKAAYVAYNTLVSQLRDKTFVAQADTPKKTWAFIFTGEKEKIVVAWPRTAASAPSGLRIVSDAAHAELVDLMGNRAPLTIASGQVRVPPAKHPCFVVLHDAAQSPRVTEL